MENIDKAKVILRTKCLSVECASMVALACEKKGLKKDAIEFLIVSQKKEEAFNLAANN